MSKHSLSNILFLLSLFILSVSASTGKLKEAIADEQSTVGIYPSLLQFVVPTTKMNCSTINSLLNLFNQGYAEIATLNTYSCIKGIFDSKVAQLQSIIKNGQCVNDTVPATPSAPAIPNPPAVACDNWVWVIDNNNQAWFRNPSSGQWTKTCTQQFGCNIPYFIDRFPTCSGGYSWMIGPSSGPWWIKDSTTYWQRPGGFSWNFLYIRVSGFDQSVWAITIDNQVQYAANNAATFGGMSNPTGTKVRYLDVSPKDGSGYVISSGDYRVFTTPGPGQAWTEITGLTVLNLRVISNGFIFAIGKDNNAYYKSSNTDAWKTLDGQGTFTFIDVNNRGRIYAIKKDHSVWTREYIGGTWADTGKAMETVRVMDDGACYGVGYNDNGNNQGYLWMRNGTISSGSWSQVATNNGLGAVTSLWGPSNHKFYWSQNSVTYDETV